MSKQILEPTENQAIIHVEPKEAVKERLKMLKDVYAEIALIDSQIPQDIKDNMQSLEDKAKAIQAEIKDLVSFEVQESIKTEDGEAIYRKGHKLVTYNGKALDSITDDKVRKEIEKYRKETETKGSARIEVY